MDLYGDVHSGDEGGWSAAAGGDGCHAGERGEGCLVTQPAAVRPEHQELGGSDRPTQGNSSRSAQALVTSSSSLVSCSAASASSHQCTAGDGADRADGDTVLDAVGRQGAQPGAAVKLLVGAAVAQVACADPAGP